MTPLKTLTAILAMLETQCFASPNIGNFLAMGGFWMLFGAILTQSIRVNHIAKIIVMGQGSLVLNILVFQL